LWRTYRFRLIIEKVLQYPLHLLFSMSVYSDPAGLIYVRQACYEAFVPIDIPVEFQIVS